MPRWIVGPAIALVFIVLLVSFLGPLGQWLTAQFGDIGGAFPVIIVAAGAVLIVLGVRKLLDHM